MTRRGTATHHRGSVPYGALSDTGGAPVRTAVLLRAAALCIAAFLSCSCAMMRRPTAAVPADEAMAARIAGAISGIAAEYRINPFDLLEVTVYQEPDLTRSVRVSQDGSITFPLVGRVELAGLTVMEAEQRLAKLLEADYLVNPQVSIFIKEYHSKKVFIIGEVRNPGSFNVPQDKPLTVLEAVALAGGFTNVAAADDIRVIRVVNGAQQYMRVRASEITRGGDKSKDLILAPNDIIFVPERLF